MHAHRRLQHRVTAIVALAVAALSLAAASPTTARKTPHRIYYRGVHIVVSPNPAGTRSTVTIRFRARQNFSYTVWAEQLHSGDYSCETSMSRTVVFVHPGRIARVRFKADPGYPWCTGRWSVHVAHIDFGPDPCAGYGDVVCRDSPAEYDHFVGGAHFTVRRYARRHRRR